ncbi:unnamed protein product [Linum trigynum]
MEGRAIAVISFLCLYATPDSINGNDVRMIGIYGPSGSGKATVAMAVYNAILSSSTYIASLGESLHNTDKAVSIAEKQLAYEIDGEGPEGVQYSVHSQHL